ncbi:uncharacterized protein RCC_02248 [Ramularia collo-cygni]|uniref:Uncharacterized protein n=1 Tax=Ramularia collo-cygni TaxID=112498 RepID=A0A2D3URZ5_9PEZI|nr:uncharacterized protein RCC_02248 [Ramularia collo-cygni]CZT16405.1 uncharacterized protein RCC_02248 [Ramularia collo-cygni]
MGRVPSPGFQFSHGTERGLWKLSMRRLRREWFHGSFRACTCHHFVCCCLPTLFSVSDSKSLPLFTPSTPSSGGCLSLLRILP